MSHAPTLSADTYEQLGHITRNLSEALKALGLDQSLSAVTQEMPDARDRLVYVGKLTKDAAHKVIEVVEQGSSACQSNEIKGQTFSEVIRRQAQLEPSPAMYRAMLTQCANYALHTAEFSERQNAMLTEILMTQTFQDLSGQIIKKVVDIISRTESQLLALLMNAQQQHANAALTPVVKLDGPQVPDKALQQTEVDDLLSSLGF